LPIGVELDPKDVDQTVRENINGDGKSGKGVLRADKTPQPGRGPARRRKIISLLQ
jgi:hypothetical protein